MSKIFINILDLGYVASLMIIVILLLRILLLKKVRRFTFKILWGIVALRLIIPFSFASNYSVLHSTHPVYDTILSQDTPVVSTQQTTTTPTPSPEIYSESYEINNTELIANHVPASPERKVSLLYYLPNVWIIGLIILLSYGFISALTLNAKISCATLLQENTYECDRISSPFVWGLFKQKIIVPYGMNSETYKYVLCHEKKHIENGDYILKIFAYILTCIYWFNPLIWLAYLLFSQDIEVACDEKVIEELGYSEKKKYAEALLFIATGDKRSIFSSPGFGESDVSKRVKCILRYKSIGKRSIALIFTLALILGFVFFFENEKISIELPKLSDSIKNSETAGNPKNDISGEAPAFKDIRVAMNASDVNSFDDLVQYYQELFKCGNWTYRQLIPMAESGKKYNLIVEDQNCTFEVNGLKFYAELPNDIKDYTWEPDVCFDSNDEKIFFLSRFTENYEEFSTVPEKMAVTFKSDNTYLINSYQSDAYYSWWFGTTMKFYDKYYEVLNNHCGIFNETGHIEMIDLTVGAEITVLFNENEKLIDSYNSQVASSQSYKLIQIQPVWQINNNIVYLANFSKADYIEDGIAAIYFEEDGETHFTIIDVASGSVINNF